jgi:DNA gyrase subunit A
MKVNLLDIVDKSFSTYAAMTIQDRAIVDVRDGIKPAARQCMYAQYLEKIIYKKPFKKSNKSVAAAMDHYYVHGDASCYALLARLAKSFTMRYPLEDFEGSYGTISGGNTEAASRYTEMRLGELGYLMYEGIEKDCIDKWFNNYDDTEQFPSVLPSLGFYNICNGSLGIATALSSSIPQFNLKEINEAMIKLLWNPNISFDEIYCAPDFCTGATILNADEVKESLKNGTGRSAIIRSTVTYDEKENCLYITEIPYGVYTGTIIKQIKDAVEKAEIIGIKKIDDLSTRKANIKILLEKNVNVNKIVKQLYKLTSTQDSYTINMVMLDNGTTPKVFGWKEALQAHLNHEIKVYTKIHQYDLKKIEDRINIINGILLAIASIDEVVKLIKSSKNKDEAKEKLIERFDFNEPQVNAILKMTLSRLINLEIQSFKDEKEKLLLEKDSILEILSNKELLYKEIEDGLRRVAEKFGDERRTKLMNLNYKGEAEDAEPIEKKELLIYYTNLSNIYTLESTTLVKTKRGGKGSKIKLANNEFVTKVLRDDNFSSLLIFSNKGKMYHISADELPINTKINIAQLFEFEQGEKPTTLTSLKSKEEIKYFTFVTKNGIIKKTLAEEYNIKRGKSLKAINLKDNDEVVNVMFMNEEKVGILTYSGNFVIINTEDVRAIGRAAAGVKAIKLSDGDYVIDANTIPNSHKFLITLSEKGLTKKTSIEEFPICNRGIKGKKISDVREGDRIIKYLTLEEDCDIIINSKRKVIKINSSELRTLSRAAIGVKSIDIADNDIAVDLTKE